MATALSVLPPIEVRRARVRAIILRRVLPPEVRKARVHKALKSRQLDRLYRDAEKTIIVCVRGAARTYARDLDPHEIQSEAHQAFLRVAANWRADGGASFTTLLNIAINRGVRTKAYTRRRHRRTFDGEQRSSFTIEPVTDVVEATMPALTTNTCFEKSRTEKIIAKAEKVLQIPAMSVLLMLIDGKTPAAAAKELGIGRGEVKQLIAGQIVPAVFGCTVDTLYANARLHRLVV